MRATGRWLHPSSWNAVILFIALGIFGGLFALTSYNLIVLFMANFRFISQHGSLALQLGALRQALELVGWLYLSIALYVAFKACEIELVSRLRTARAADPVQAQPPTPR